MALNEDEVLMIQSLPKEERVSYFISRIKENDAVWSISDSSGWKVVGKGNKKVVQLWPYSDFVFDVSKNEKAAMTDFISFVEVVLPKFAQSKIEIEIFPVPFKAGEMIEAEKLLSSLKSELAANDL